MAPGSIPGASEVKSSPEDFRNFQPLFFRMGTGLGGDLFVYIWYILYLIYYVGFKSPVMVVTLWWYMHNSWFDWTVRTTVPLLRMLRSGQLRLPVTTPS